MDIQSQANDGFTAPHRLDGLYGGATPAGSSHTLAQPRSA